MGKLKVENLYSLGVLAACGSPGIESARSAVSSRPKKCRNGQRIVDWLAGFACEVEATPSPVLGCGLARVSSNVSLGLMSLRMRSSELKGAKTSGNDPAGSFSEARREIDSTVVRTRLKLALV